MGASDTPRVEEQWVLYPGGPIAQYALVEDQWVLYPAVTNQSPLINEQWVVYAGGQISPFTIVTEQYTLAALGSTEAVTPEVHEQWVLLVTGDNPPTAPVGAWTYLVDGHLFYGLNLGNSQGTVVYDAVTGRWSEWQSGTLPWMNINLTTQWKGETYGASLVAQDLLKFDPESNLDDSFRANTFIVSGRFEYNQRQYLSVPEVQIHGSIGLDGGDVKLRYSDDDTQTFSADRTVTVQANDRGKNVVFYDLGSIRAPGRIFEIEDAGTMRRVGALTANIPGLEDDDGGR